MMTKQQLETIKRQYQPLAPSPVLDLVAEIERLQAENEHLRNDITDKINQWRGWAEDHGVHIFARGAVNVCADELETLLPGEK